MSKGNTGALLACIADDKERALRKAAPDLLAACEAARILVENRRMDTGDRFPALRRLNEQLNAAIAKAEGRTP